uniref:Uncharacterized protein n=1 Tax=Rhizophora mucronata TaxID=61149 RepID=A0A2P2MTI5_RHIMU
MHTPSAELQHTHTYMISPFFFSFFFFQFIFPLLFLFNNAQHPETLTEPKQQEDKKFDKKCLKAYNLLFFFFFLSFFFFCFFVFQIEEEREGVGVEGNSKPR